MPACSRMTALLAMGIAPLLAGCEPSDWREGVEKPEDCIVRVMSEQTSESVLFQPAAQIARLVPTFTYDISRMDQQAVDDLLNSAGAAEAEVIYFGETAMQYRLRDDPVASANAAAAGCAFQQPDMRLTEFSLEPLQPEEDAIEASAD